MDLEFFIHLLSFEPIRIFKLYISVVFLRVMLIHVCVVEITLGKVT